MLLCVLSYGTGSSLRKGTVCDFVLSVLSMVQLSFVTIGRIFHLLLISAAIFKLVVSDLSLAIENCSSICIFPQSESFSNEHPVLCKRVWCADMTNCKTRGS